MTAVTDALLALAVAAQLLAVIGTATMPEPLDRLHYGGLAVLAAALAAGAILSDQGFSLIADKALLLAAFVAVSSPVAVQAVARAVRIDRRGSLDASGDDVERLR